MDPVSNIDRLVLILRQRLESRASTRGKVAGRPAPAAGPSKISNLQALAALDGGDDDALGRALIEGILTDAFGDELLNDAHFQQIVERVTQAIGQQEDAKRLLSGLVNAVRQDGRLTG